MKTYKVVKSESRILSNGGLTMVGKILENGCFRELCEKLNTAHLHPRNQISCSDLFSAAIGMLCRGSSTYDSVRDYSSDIQFYKDALNISRFPSSERLRQRFDQATSENGSKYSIHFDFTLMNLAILIGNNVIPAPLSNGLVPLDIDVTPLNESKSHKEGVSRTYKGFDGYAPIMAYIGKQGFLINNEFRPGKQHSQNGTPEFLVDTIDLANHLMNKKLLIRLDSGNDAVENIGIIIERGHYLIIKRNLRSEKREDWLKLAKEYAPIQHKPRDGKIVYIGSTWRPITYIGMDGTDKTQVMRIVYEVTERTIDKHGQHLIDPDIDVNTWWDNTGFSDEDVIELYHQHGTMEQYHSEFKSDMGVERLPSGKYATNRLVHDLSMIAYNILRIIGSLLSNISSAPIRGKTDRRRLRTVIMNIICTPAHIISHARESIMDLGRSNAWAEAFIEIYNRLFKISTA